MESLDAAALSFAELLVGAHDPDSLYKAFELGLPAVFPLHHSLVASFAFNREHPGPGSTWSHPKRPEHTPEYWARNGAMHPGFAYAYERNGIQVCLCSDVPPATGSLDTEPYFLEFMQPEGYRHAMAILIWHNRELVGQVVVNRTKQQGDFDDVERARATALQPLIAAAYRRIAAAHGAVDARLAQERLLATLPIAAVVYAANDGRVLFHNRASKEALARWRGESAKKRPRAVTAKWLPSEIVDACAVVPAAGAQVPSARGPQRAVLRKMDARSHFANDVVLIVIEDDDDAGARPSSSWLRIARALSGAEQDVAKLAARGLTNAEIGKKLGKSAGTVKKQLEAVFEKAGVANRAQLTAVVAGFRATRPSAARATTARATTARATTARASTARATASRAAKGRSRA
jgi:DNA-binding CsgD family transcriptional regulator